MNLELFGVTRTFSTISIVYLPNEKHLKLYAISMKLSCANTFGNRSVSVRVSVIPSG